MNRDIVVCSLEPWDEVWRRNQFLVRELLELHPAARVLFVAPPWDAVTGLRSRTPPPRPALRVVEPGRLWELTPRKWLPRVAGPFADRSLVRQVCSAIDRLGLADPVLWVNDSVYAGMVADRRFPAVYDVTDDWLLLPLPARELRRQRRRDDVLLRGAEEVVVCSESLARSRGVGRPVHLIPNAVDTLTFQAKTARPVDLPKGDTAVYVGTLHDERIDLELVVALAESVPSCSIVMVGPVFLRPASVQRLSAVPGIHLLGARPYAQVPGYLQHATVVIVPHLLTPFTASLDPIKAYECEAVGTPTFATPLPGFVPDRNCIRTAPRESWVEMVRAAIADPATSAPATDLPSWHDRAVAFDAVLETAVSGHRSRSSDEQGR